MPTPIVFISFSHNFVSPTVRFVLFHRWNSFRTASSGVTFVFIKLFVCNVRVLESFRSSPFLCAPSLDMSTHAPKSANKTIPSQEASAQSCRVVFVCQQKGAKKVDCVRWGSNPRLRRDHHLKVAPWTARPRTPCEPATNSPHTATWGTDELPLCLNVPQGLSGSLKNPSPRKLSSDFAMLC